MAIAGRRGVQSNPQIAVVVCSSGGQTKKCGDGTRNRPTDAGHRCVQSSAPAWEGVSIGSILIRPSGVAVDFGRRIALFVDRQLPVGGCDQIDIQALTDANQVD